MINLKIILYKVQKGFIKMLSKKKNYLDLKFLEKIKQKDIIMKNLMKIFILF